ncbi:acyltransferase family protein [Methylobacterium radiodurans]|uniref:Acyltransferase n=1 Tax=Methylobacterium radiodurans TaxID=2202828 RepID=A0A2U8VPA7_9HYPH|nr:acyltransferase [Methylobacterium radiodurans]AWN35454.1 acyltransferase [Methylobacterium radiodurans]
MQTDTERPAAPPAAVQALTRRAIIPGLDGIRAVAVLVVMLGHYGLGRIVPGGLGVTIFFFLSGFLITTLLLRESDASGRIDLRNFYVRRFLRLAPELTVFVLVTGALALVLGKVIRPAELLAALFYVTNYYHLAQGMCIETCADWHSLWSLAVEEHFYLIFPLVLILNGSAPRRLLLILSAVLLISPVWRAVVEASGRFDPEWTYKASDARFDSIAYGAWLAVVFARFPAWLVRVRDRGVPLLALAGLLMLLSLTIRDPMFRATLRYTLQGVALGLLFVVLYASARGAPLLSVLEWRPLRWIGQVSYGAYLWHFVPLSAGLYLMDVRSAYALSGAQTLVMCLGGTAATLGLAWLSQILVARPVLGLRHRFGPRPPGRRAPAALAPRLADAGEVLGR